MDKRLRNNKGITMMSLVITIVLMLILAAVAINAVIDGGIFDSATNASREQKKESMLDAVEVAEEYLRAHQTFDASKEFDIFDLVNKIKEKSDITENDYNINVDQETQTATIEDIETGIVIAINLHYDRNGKIVVEKYETDNVELATIPNITYTITPVAGSDSQKFNINVTATMNSNEMSKIYLPDGTVVSQDANAANKKQLQATYLAEKNGTFKFVAESANGKTATRYITLDDIMVMGDIMFQVNNANLTNEDVDLTITYDPNLKIGGQKLTNKDRFQYRIGDGEWKIASTAITDLPIEKNTMIYARYYDGKSEYKTSSISVSNIDKLKPIIATVSASDIKATEFTLNFAAEDASETSEYLKSGIKNIELFINGQWVTTTTNMSYTVTGKKVNREFECKIIVFDKAGNFRESDVITVETKGDGSPVPISLAVDVGDYVNYDAGTWNSSVDGPKITSGGGYVSWGGTLVNSDYYYSGIKDGGSRNKNATLSNYTGTVPEGWRVWSIEGDTVTLISAGCPESYRIGYYTGTAVNYLLNRDCSIYENELASSGSAHILTIDEARIWYNNNFNTNYSFASSWTYANFSEEEPISVLNNGAYYWFASSGSSSYSAYYCRPSYTATSYNKTYGLRFLVTLKDDVIVRTDEGNGATDNPWKLMKLSVELAANDVTSNGFKLTATGKSDLEISKYEFYVNDVLEKTVTTSDETVEYVVTGKTTLTEYLCKVIMYDVLGNAVTSEEIVVVPFVEYPFGTTVFAANKTFDGSTTGTYNNPIIPKGFYPVNENGAYWGTAEGFKKGLVIEDAEQNQYVWVPVDGTNVKFERYEFGKGTTSMASCSEVLPEALSSSVTLNQGFYIARFEAGVSDAMKVVLKNANNGTDVTKLTSDTTATYGTGTYLPVSKQGAMVWNYLSYSENRDGSGNGALKVASNLYPEGSNDYGVVSTLIYGAQWDTALKFIGAYNVGEEGYATYATNSTGMGNYEGTIGSDTSTAKPDVCGALPAFRQKNIYDMAGNVREWTNEKNGSSRVLRGGASIDSGSENPASDRIGYYYATLSRSDVGFRLALYIRSN